MVDLSNLSNLTQFEHIVIQCHDIPDADAICSGFALQQWLKSLGTEATLVYSGPAQITKPNLVMMLHMLHIELAYVTEYPADIDLLITVDCQRGAGNVRALPLPEGVGFAVIDHHHPEIEEKPNCIIRSNLASCATLIWDLLNKQAFSMDRRVQNALFYGLFTDSNGLSELSHPLDRDLAEVAIDGGLIRKLKNAAITAEELDIIGAALTNRHVLSTVGVFHAAPCDANLLGFTSDIARQVAQLDCCVVYSRQQHGLKLSIRSSAREYMASEFASFLCRECGSGGGNIEKAGGFIGFDKVTARYPALKPEEYLNRRVQVYLDYYDLIYAGKNDIDFGGMRLYRKLPRPVGYVNCTDIFPVGTKITIRTLEGDVDTHIGEDLCLMIGVQGEVYPIHRSRLEKSYHLVAEPYREVAEYTPIILNRISGERKGILPFAHTCIPSDDKFVRAVALEKAAKVFTNWDLDKYYHGNQGDYLVANDDDHDDCYIVRSDIFVETYVPC